MNLDETFGLRDEAVDWIERNRMRIFRYLIFNEKMFIVKGKYQGKDVTYKMDNKITGKTIRVKLMELNNGKSSVSSKFTLNK